MQSFMCLKGDVDSVLLVLANLLHCACTPQKPGVCVLQAVFVPLMYLVPCLQRMPHLDVHLIPSILASKPPDSSEGVCRTVNASATSLNASPIHNAASFRCGRELMFEGSTFKDRSFGPDTLTSDHVICNRKLKRNHLPTRLCFAPFRLLSAACDRE